MVNAWLISTGRLGAEIFFQKKSKGLLTALIGVRITRLIDGGNVAGGRVL